MSNKHKAKKGLAPARPAPLPLTPEETMQLDYEISWCIEELESLLMKDLNDKQRKQAELSLKILNSSETPLIKKRQVMRQQFGDYKQQIERKKKSGKASVKVSPSIEFKNISPSKNTLCYKIYKSKLNLECDNFKFNFKVGESSTSETSSSQETESVVKEKESEKKLSFTNIDNSFRFNFQTS